MQIRRILLAGVAVLPLALAATALAQTPAGGTDEKRQVVVEPNGNPPAVDTGTPLNAAEAEAKGQEPAPLPSPAAPPGAVAQIPAGKAGKLPEGVVRPADPVAAAAFDVFVKHCARCHQDGMLTSRGKPAKNFGNVLNLEELAHASERILPGNPDGSKIVQQLLNQEMPYDLYYEFDTSKPEVTEQDIAAVRAWVESLGEQTAAACAKRQFVSNENLVRMLAADLQQLPDHRVKGTRYLTLTNLYNACTDDKAMEVYRQGVVKLLNSLSRSPDVVRLEPVGPEGAVLRFNLIDLGWEEADWDALLAAYPYATRPDDRMFSFLEKETNTKLPYMRADWFAFTASRPGLYERLLGLANTFDDLQVALGLDVKSNIEKFVAKRSGFQKSGVSQNNRLIERHPIKTGYFWTSYDFAGNREKQSLFDFPLGPGGEKGFDHDGGETIFSLPNGFQAYYLNNAKGDKLDKGPTTIVRDLTRKDLTVTNGISCMGCHDQGIRKAKDDIRDSVMKDRSFSRSEKDQVAALYPVAAEMDKILEADGQRFADAMKRAGLDPTLKLNGVEMINALSDRYEATVDLRLAAAEFGLPEDEFVDRMQQVGKKAFALKRRLEQGLVPRDQFEHFYKELVADVSDDTLIEVAGAKADKLEVAKVEAAPKEVARTFDIALFSDRQSYRLNDKPVFSVKATADCNLTLINVDSAGQGTVIFPNKFQQDNFVPAEKEFQFPGSSAPFQFRLADKGTETVIAVCNASKSTVDGILHDFQKQAFTAVGDAKARTRQIVVEAAEKVQKGAAEVAKAKASGKSADAAVAAAPKPEIVARTAIKLKVE